MRGKSGLLAFALVTCWVFQAQAAHQSRARTETWDAPPPDEQLAADPTLIPPAQGAIFVPAMTDPRLEPPYLVYKDGKLLHTVSTGRRAIVTPGVYEVQLGSGPPEQRLRRKVLVKEGQTTVVPPTWGRSLFASSMSGLPFSRQLRTARPAEAPIFRGWFGGRS